jgi:hypothetical protein
MELRKLRISYLAEQFAQQILAEHLGVPAADIKHLTEEFDHAPHDLEYDGIKYDVKYSAPTSAGSRYTTTVWDFTMRGKPKGCCDYFVLVGSKLGVFSSVFLVPEADAPGKHLRIPVEGVSKWQQYKIWR